MIRVQEVERKEFVQEEIICFKYNIPDLKQDHLVVAGATISQFMKATQGKYSVV